MFLKREFTFGKIQLPSNIFYAPLAGVSNFPFRKMSSRYKPGLLFCEMVKMDALVRNDAGTLEMLNFSKDMHPIGGQICGSKPEIAGKAAKMIEELGFDTVDLNCGCPVDKITKDGSGSGMLKTPEKIGEILANMVASVKIPVTVKIRLGWDDASINAVEVVKIAEKAGATAITIHGRTRAQAYKGEANWDEIRLCKEAANKILVIGNGDLFSPQNVEEIFQKTGCDGVLIARGTMGAPWIAQDIYNYLEHQTFAPHSAAEQFAVLMEHYQEMKNYLPERKVLVEMRKASCWFVKNGYGASKFRDHLSHASSIVELDTLLADYNASI